MNLRQLFSMAADVVESACSEERQKLYLSREGQQDMETQCKILLERACTPLTREEDIINNFVISASSYSILRRTFKVNSLETIRNFDGRFGTNFFGSHPPQYSYSEWTEIVLEWGRKIFPGKADSLTNLAVTFENEYDKGDKSLNKKPEPRIIWTLASGLPVVKKLILKNPEQFFDQYHSIAKKNPGQAFKNAQLFSENKSENTKIVGMGAAMVCDFFKNIGLSYYVKIDIHMKDVLGGLSLQKKLNDKEMFILSWLISKEVGIEPFYLDKIIFIGKKFLKLEFSSIFEDNKLVYQGAINDLIKEINKYK